MKVNKELLIRYFGLSERPSNLFGSGRSDKRDLTVYARLKLDIYKLKYEKWSKYRCKQPKCIVLGTPKKPEKGQE